jgi:diguanylate cyclase (GGDEF)-like protein
MACAPALADGDKRFRRIYTDDGLISNTVYDIYQDSTGYLWISTDQGATRYDGHRFVHFQHDPANPSSLPNNWVEMIREDQHGKIWVATKSGLGLLDPATGKFINFHHDPEAESSLSDNWVTNVFTDSQGRTWVGTNRGLNRQVAGTSEFMRERFTEAKLSPLEQSFVQAIVEDGSGRIWFGTGEGLFYFDPESGTYSHADFVGDFYFTRGIAAADGQLWFGTRYKGVLQIDPRRTSLARHWQPDAEDAATRSGNVWALAEAADGKIWVGYWGEGIDVLDPVSGTVAPVNHIPDDATSMPDDAVSTIWRDDSGLLWIGTQDGIGIYNPGTDAVERYGNRRSGRLSSSRVWALEWDAGGGVWVGTDNGLNRLVSGEDGGILESVAGVTSGMGVFALQRGGGDALWIGGEFGVLYTAPGQQPDDPDARQIPAAGTVYSLAAEGVDRAWVGNQDGELLRINAEGKILSTHFGDEFLEDSEYISSLQTVPDGSLWVGTTSGLWHFDPESGAGTPVDLAPGAPRPVIYDMALDSRSRLWLATGGDGVLVIDTSDTSNPTFLRALTTESGMPGNSAKAVVIDTNGDAWISNVAQLIRVSPVTWEPIVYSSLFSQRHVQFSEAALAIGGDGRVVVGSNRGFYRFSPDSIEANTFEPPVVISSASVLAQPVAMDFTAGGDLQIRIRSADRLVSFNFAALDFTDPRGNRYVYQLEGSDSDWLPADESHQVTYMSLTPGKYVLRVRGSNGDGRWSPHQASLGITVMPPLWMSPWAYMFYSLSGGGLLVLGRIRRRKRMQELQRQTTHDLLTGLPNRKFYDEEMTRRIELSGPEGHLALCFIDLDEFKKVNDTLGHAKGDLLLKLVSERIKSCIRHSDFVARLAGDEFILILNHNIDKEMLNETMGRILRACNEPFNLFGERTYISASIGVSFFPAHGETPQKLLHHADRAMYRAKGAGKNCYSVFNPIDETSAELD